AISINHKKEQARCLNNMGIALWKFDNYTEALIHFAKALSIIKSINSAIDEADILANLGLVYREIGNFDEAENYFLQSIEYDKHNTNKQGYYVNLLNIGSLKRLKYLYKKHDELINSAIEIYNQILRESNDPYIKMKALNNLASAYNDINNYHLAIACLNESLNIAINFSDFEEQSIIYNNLGIISYNLGNYENAIKYHSKAIELALRLRSGQVLWEAYLELANAYRRKGDENEAIINYKNSIAITEDIRSKLSLEEYKSTYLGSDKRLDAYYKLIDLLVKRGIREKESTYYDEAFNYLERAKARAFLDSLEVSKVIFNETVSQELRYQEIEIMNEISKLFTKLLNPELSSEQKQQISRRLDAAEQELEALRREIRKNYPAYANLRYPEFITANLARKTLLPADTLVIAYLLSSDSSYAFAMTRKNLRVYSIGSLNEIREKIKEYLGMLTDPGNSDFSLGYDLYKVLIEPGLDGSKVKRVVIIPDDILHFLPFETLKFQNHGNRDWLVAKYSLSYAPSLTSLKEIIERGAQQSQKPKKLLLAVGDPSFELNGGQDLAERVTLKSFYEPGIDINLERLQFSLQEVDKITGYFPKKKTEILLAKNASEENLKNSKLTDFRIVHFATHCLIDDKKPARSSIVLRLDQDPQEDGLLQTREIFNLKFNADLVTLSACQTAYGALIRGEGIEGLSRAFFYAGASSLILSLWPINDQATAQLMDRFYYYLKSGHSVEKGLQKAKLELINSQTLSHPYYWGGFIVAGNAARVVVAASSFFWIFIIGGGAAGALLLIWLRNGRNGYLNGSHTVKPNASARRVDLSLKANKEAPTKNKAD
ncbi:MAG: CHAT domain-containing protein, partial [Candidatus Aminicenantales bacterium]